MHLFKRILKYFVVLFFLASIGHFEAQAQVNVTVAFDSTVILVGDQIYFNVTVDQPRNVKISFPSFTDTLIKNIEILSSLPADTAFISNQTIKIQKRYLITSFDSGDYKIDFIRFPFINDGIADTAFSNVSMLYVRALPIKDPNKIADIKGVIEIPLTLKEILTYVLAGFGGLLLLAFIAYVIYRLKNKKPVFGLLEKPKIPPHVTAFRDLEKLRNEKLWQQGFYKQYYSRLTDILRAYIEVRLKIPALESTSDEIIAALRSNSILDDKLKSDLNNMLSSADLVKFAKAEPFPDENENAWQFANDFINKTFRDKTIEETEEVITAS